MGNHFDKVIDNLIDQVIDSPALDAEIDKAADEVLDGASMVDVLVNLCKTTVAMFFNNLFGKKGAGEVDTDVVTIEDKEV